MSDDKKDNIVSLPGVTRPKPPKIPPIPEENRQDIVEELQEGLMIFANTITTETSGVLVLSWDKDGNSQKVMLAQAEEAIQMQLLGEFCKINIEEAYYELIQSMYEDQE